MIGATAAMPQNFAALFILGATAGLLGAALILPIRTGGVVNRRPHRAQTGHRACRCANRRGTRCPIGRRNT
jgi:hypothetical protein